MAGLPAIAAEQWSGDPLLAWRDWLPESEWPREWQPSALDELRDPEVSRAAFVGCRESGKSRFAAMVGLHHLATRPGSLVLAVLPTERQRRSALWEEIRILWSRSTILRNLLPGWSVTIDRVDTGVPGWRMESVASDQPEHLEGFHGGDALLVLDESAGITDEIWNSLQGINPRRVLAVGTAGDDSGWFAGAFGAQGWQWDLTRRIDARDIPRLKETYQREQKRLGATSPIFRRMWNAEFASVSEWGFLDFDLAASAIGHDPDATDELTRLMRMGPPREPVIGVDPARGGPNGDDSAMCFVRGRKIERFAVLPPGNEMEQAAQIVTEAHRYRARRIAIDSGGLGHGVYSRCEDLLAGEPIRVEAYNASEKSPDDSASNLKTALLLQLRQSLLEKTIGFPKGPDGERLCRELASLRLVTEQRSGKVRSADPRRSPDFADAALAALSLRFRLPSLFAASPPGV